MSLLVRATIAATVVAASACIADEPGQEIAAQAATTQAAPVDNVNAAENSFRASVLQSVGASAAAAGVTFASTGVALGYHPSGRTVAAGATTRGTQAIFLSRPVARASGATYSPGLYEIAQTSTGAVVRYHHPSLGFIAVPPPPPGPVAFHTPFGDDVCPDGPVGLAEYCQRIAACYAYDLYC